MYKAIIIACLLLIPAFWVYSEAPKEAKKEGGKAVLITTAKAQLRPVERSVSLVGELQAEEEAVVKAEVKGKVKAVYKGLGDAVKKGETIVLLDSEEYEISREQTAQALKEARSRYELARLNWERAEGLFKKGLISERERDEAGKSLEGLDAAAKERHSAVELATKRLRDVNIAAPFSGVIKERFVNVGDYLDDKTAVAAIVDLSPLKLRASVPEKAAGIIRNGMKVLIGVEAYPGKVFEGSVARISPSLDPKTRTLAIEATFHNKDRALKPGFFAAGRVVTKKADRAIFVPEESLVSFAGIKKVFVIENGAAVERLVKVGERVESMVEITEGLKGGDVVATSALNKLSTGVKVEIKR